MKKIISAILALAVAGTLYVPAFAAGQFTDVSGWAEPYIERAAGLGLVNGTGGGKYSPDSQVTYGQFATMLVNIKWADELDDAKESGYDRAWWEPYAHVANTHGVFDGTPMCDFFAWDDINDEPVNRADMAMMAYNFMLANGVSATSVANPPMTDIEHLNEDQTKAIIYCCTNGILSGVGNGRFSPDSLMNRAQAATVLCGVWNSVSSSTPSKPNTPSTPSTAVLSAAPTYDDLPRGFPPAGELRIIPYYSVVRETGWDNDLKVSVYCLVSTQPADSRDNFTFRIAPLGSSNGVIMPNNCIESVFSFGGVAFSPITFTAPGTYTFRITQEEGPTNTENGKRVWDLVINVKTNGGTMDPARPKGAIGGQYDVSKYTAPADTNKDGWLTRTEVQAVLAQIEREYPEGTTWDINTRYPGSHEALGIIGGHYAATACQGFAHLVTDRIFGNLPQYTVPINELRIGDLLSSQTGNHANVCFSEVHELEGKMSSLMFQTVDGNYGGHVVWRVPSEYSGWVDGPGDHIYSRYPKITGPTPLRLELESALLGQP